MRRDVYGDLLARGRFRQKSSGEERANPDAGENRRLRLQEPPKTQIRSFWEGKKWFKSLSLKIKMRYNRIVSADFLLCWVCRDFSHSLAWLGRRLMSVEILTGSMGVTWRSGLFVPKPWEA